MEQFNHSLVGQLGRAHHHIMREVEGSVTREVDAELSGSQARTLHFIAYRSEEGVVCQRDIEEAFDLKPSSVSLLLRNMEQRGLILRQSVEGDGRLKSVHLTPEAKELSQRLVDTLVGMETVVSRGVTPEEREVFLAVIEKIHINLKANQQERG